MVTNEVVSEDQQRQVRRWDSDRIGGCYLSDLPIDATKVLAGLLLVKVITLSTVAQLSHQKNYSKWYFLGLNIGERSFTESNLKMILLVQAFLDMDY